MKKYILRFTGGNGASVETMNVFANTEKEAVRKLRRGLRLIVCYPAEWENSGVKTEAEFRMYEEKANERYNPCFYCRKTLTCIIECEARCGFNSIITAKLNDCITRKNTEEDWQNKLLENASRYCLPISMSRGNKNVN